MPLILTPARETVPRGILTGRLRSILSVAKHDIPEATLSRHSNKHSAMSVNPRPWSIPCVSFHTFLLALPTHVAVLEPRLGGKILDPKEPKA